MKNKFKLLVLLNAVVLISIIVFETVNYFNNSRLDIVYVDNIKLFNGFNMTKDLKGLEEKKINTYTKQLDSLYAVLQTLQNKDDSLFQNLQQQIAYKSKAFQEMKDNYSLVLSNKVWDRLNDYITEYAQGNNLKLVLGTNGKGNIMYGEESIDITSQIIEFSNKKYEGNN